MAIIKISELPAADSPVSPSDVAPFLQNGVTKKASIDQFGFLPAGTNAVTRTIQAKLRDVVSVKDFGAVGDGVADDTAAIQAAIDAAATFGVTGNFGAAVYFPSGRYIVSSTISLPGSQYVSLFGTGRSSVISWNGANSDVMFSMDNGTDGSQIFIEKLHFLVPTNNNSVTAFEFCKTPSNAIVNVTVRQNLFENFNIAIDMNQETDQMLIDDNYFLTYYGAGVRLTGYGANIYVKNNHFRDGNDGSYAVITSNAVNIVIDTNTVQSANNGMKGFYLADTKVFKVVNTYFEVAAAGVAGDGPFLTMFEASDGYVADNFTTGACGVSVMVVDTDCRVITFGNHRHSISGGTPTQILEVDGSPVGITITGTFDTNNTQITPFSGSVDFFLGYANSSNNSSFTTPLIYSKQSISQYRDLKNVAGSTTDDLINFGSQVGAWLVYATQVTENYWSVSFVHSDGTTAAITNTYQNNANMVLSVTGNKLQVANGISGTRTIKFTAIRIF